MRGGAAACCSAWPGLRSVLLLALSLASGACGFDSEPVRARTAGGAGTDSNIGQSGQGGQAGNGGRSGSAGSSSGDASMPDAGPAIDAGRDSGTPDGGNPRDAETPDGGDPPITCIPNRIGTCYSGPTGTRSVGACKVGTHRCKSDGNGYGPCTDEVLPSPDVCSNDIDDDCDGIVNDGYPDVDGCECEPGAQEECYTGPAAFKGVGNCALGAITCNALGTGWSECSGDVLPTAPRCALADRDCNGISDDRQDLDGDGYSLCDSDCCDRTGDGCATPALVNPGAYDVAGNGIDDDCTGTPDDALSACDGTLTTATTDALDYAKALDLCQRSMRNLPRAAQRWGVLDASLTLSDGSGTPRPAQRLLRPSFGAIAAQHGARMVALSTGHAAAPGEVDPSFEAFEPGEELGTSSAMPNDWLAANGGAVHQVPGCPGATVSPSAMVRDSVMLKLSVRVPTNMRAFTLRAYLLSAEFPEYVCDQRSDYALALLTATASGNPSDQNLATFTTAGGVRYPLGPSLAFNDTGLFRQCQNGTLSCLVDDDPITTQITSCEGTSDLAGTGFEQAGQSGMPPCDADSQVGGGTGWLTIAGNVEPGETIELRLMIWDTEDGEYDSLVLFDDFEWSSNPVEAGLSL